jgi:Protein of unknown function (DUF1822)
MTELNLIDRPHQMALPPEAHQWARLFASKQIDVPAGKQVYYNTLSVFAVDDYLNDLGLTTDLENSNSWYPGLTSPPDSGELKIVGLGSIECRPVLATAPQVALPSPGDEIAYVIVQLSTALDTATLCGYAQAHQTGTLDLTALLPIEDLTNYFGKLRDGCGRLEDLNLEQFDPLMTEFLEEVSDREKLSLLARSLPIHESSDRKRSKQIEIQRLLDPSLTSAGTYGAVMREKNLPEHNAESKSAEQLHQEAHIRNLAAGWLDILDRIL